MGTGGNMAKMLGFIIAVAGVFSLSLHVMLGSAKEDLYIFHFRNVHKYYILI